MSNGFKETINLTNEEREVLVRLSLTPDFAVFTTIMERVLQANAYDVLTVPEIDTQKVHDYIDQYRGGYYFYKQIIGLLNKLNGKEANN